MNFKFQSFQGSLLDLLEESNSESLSRNVAKAVEQWLDAQLGIPGNILPVRKFSGFAQRGARRSIGDIEFMAADNEPLAALHSQWVRGNAPQRTFRQLLEQERLSASWSCDLPEKGNLHFGGVLTTARGRGLKLAHVEDAGRCDNGANAEGMAVRFLRMFSPWNVFLFPSFRHVVFESSAAELHGCQDLAEHPLVRQIAAQWLLSRLGGDAKDVARRLSSTLPLLSDWRDIASHLQVRVAPRRYTKAGVAPSAACPKVPPSTPVSVAEMADILRTWRAAHPKTIRLDGKESGGNRAPWLHFRIAGFQSPKDDFTTRHSRQTFSGDRYNGVFCLNGDTKAEAVDRFLDLFGELEDETDILRPSATFETRNQHRGSQRPTLVLNGTNGAHGFYCYSEEHAP